MHKVLNWIVNLIPEQYRIGIAIKKVSYTLGKLAIAGLMYGKVGTMVGSKLSPDQVVQIQTAAAGISAALLTAIQDWARVKWPDAKWL